MATAFRWGMSCAFHTLSDYEPKCSCGYLSLCLRYGFYNKEANEKFLHTVFLLQSVKIKDA